MIYIEISTGTHLRLTFNLEQATKKNPNNKQQASDSLPSFKYYCDPPISLGLLHKMKYNFKENGEESSITEERNLNKTDPLAQEISDTSMR